MKLDKEVVVEVALTNVSILIVVGLLAISLFIGTSNNDYTLLRLLLMGGMFFAWILFFDGLLAVLSPNFYQSIQYEKGTMKLVKRGLLLLLALGLFLYLMTFARIDIIHQGI